MGYVETEIVSDTTYIVASYMQLILAELHRPRGGSEPRRRPTSYRRGRHTASSTVSKDTMASTTVRVAYYWKGERERGTEEEELEGETGKGIGREKMGKRTR